MTATKKQLPNQSSIRWEEDLKPLVEEWFEKNSGWTISQLANQSIRKFIQTVYCTEPISNKINDINENITKEKKQIVFGLLKEKIKISEDFDDENKEINKMFYEHN